MLNTYISKTWWLFLKNWFKNFVKQCHEELSSKTWSMWEHHIPQNIFFWKLYIIIRLLVCWQQDSILLTGLGMYPQIYHALQCLFLRGSNKQHRRSRIISNFTKGQTFSFFMATKCSWGLCHNAAPLLALQKTPKKAFLSSLVWPRREYTWKVSWNES